MENTFLSHHGIKGQRWGVRRFQNEDGSLTNRGQKRNMIKENKENKILKKYIKNNKGEKLINKNYNQEARLKVTKRGRKAVGAALLAIGAQSASVSYTHEAKIMAGIVSKRGIKNYNTTATILGISAITLGTVSAALFVGKNKSGYSTNT